MEENNGLNKKVLDLEKRVDEMEQYSRVNAVEIHGVPIVQNEDFLNVVKQVDSYGLKYCRLKVQGSMPAIKLGKNQVRKERRLASL